MLSSNVRSPRGIVGAALLLALFAGCAQPSPFAQRNALIGSLRESVSQLESNNQKLQHQVANLSSENRSLENRLVEEESHNSELAKRLNDARLASGSGSRLSSDLDDEPSSGRSQNALNSRSRRASQPSNRPAPFAQIRNDLEPLPRERGEGRRAGSRRDDEGELFPADDKGAQGRLDDRQTRWLSARRNRSDESQLR